MFKYFYEAFLGKDDWSGCGSKKSDFEKEIGQAISTGNSANVESSLVSGTVRDLDLLKGLCEVISVGNFSLFEKLMTNKRVIHCIQSHKNLKSYSHELAEKGIIGSLLWPNSGNSVAYSNLLILTLDSYFPQNAKDFLAITDSLLKLKLFDINQADVTINREYDSINTPLKRNHASDNDNLMTDIMEEDIQIETESRITKTPIYLACETGDIAIVQRVLCEPNINLSNGMTSSEGGRNKTALELVREKQYFKIQELLFNYSPKIMSPLTPPIEERFKFQSALDDNLAEFKQDNNEEKAEDKIEQFSI